MRASLLLNDALGQYLGFSVPRTVRQVRLNPRDFYLRLRRAPVHNVACATQQRSLHQGQRSQRAVQGTESAESLIIEEERPSFVTCQTNLRESARRGNKLRAQKAAQDLTFHYGEQPSTSMYACLISVESDPQDGSAADVERLLQEMKNENLPHDVEVYDAALKALAIHPDHILRDTLLDEMKRRWLELDKNQWHYVITGLLRERQIELALERLRQMRAASFQPEPWLLHLFITTCLSVRAFPEALSLLQYRISYAEPVPSSIWSEVLTKAAQRISHPLIDFVWRRGVETNYMNPSSGTCIAVLNTAARRGNFRLASDVIRVLAMRASPLELWHFEALFESFLQGSDLRGALSILGLMSASGIQPSAASIRPLYVYLRAEATRIEHTLSILAEMATPERSSKWDPGPILDVCIQRYMSQSNLLDALKVYRSWDQYAALKRRPSIDTFNALLYNLHEAAPLEATRVARTLRREMKDASLAANETTNNRLIFAFLADEKDAEGLQHALDVYREMNAAGQTVLKPTATQLIERVKMAYSADPENMEQALQSVLGAQT